MCRLVELSTFQWILMPMSLVVQAEQPSLNNEVHIQNTFSWEYQSFNKLKINKHKTMLFFFKLNLLVVGHVSGDTPSKPRENVSVSRYRLRNPGVYYLT